MEPQLSLFRCVTLSNRLARTKSSNGPLTAILCGWRRPPRHSDGSGCRRLTGRHMLKESMQRTMRISSNGGGTRAWEGEGGGEKSKGAGRETAWAGERYSPRDP